jgi:tripartite-type tricarboxylate transporter receptor subunit TctC
LPRLARRPLLALGLAAATRTAGAEAPERTARIALGFPPGGAPELIARQLAAGLRERYASTVEIENRPGAGGHLVIESMQSAAPDGLTMLISPASVLTLPGQLPPGRLTAVSALAAQGLVLVLGPEHPSRTLDQFVDWVRDRGGAVRLGVPGIGTLARLAGTSIALGLGLRLEAEPFRGVGATLAALRGGQVSVAVLPPTGLAPLHRDGRLHLLATTGATPLPDLPEVPNFAGLGYPNLIIEERFDLFLPGETPTAILGGLAVAAELTIITPEYAEALARASCTPASANGDQVAERLGEERARWARLVQEQGLSLDE